MSKARHCICRWATASAALLLVLVGTSGLRVCWCGHGHEGGAHGHAAPARPTPDTGSGSARISAAPDCCACAAFPALAVADEQTHRERRCFETVVTPAAPNEQPTSRKPASVSVVAPRSPPFARIQTPVDLQVLLLI